MYWKFLWGFIMWNKLLNVLIGFQLPKIIFCNHLNFNFSNPCCKKLKVKQDLSIDKKELKKRTNLGRTRYWVCVLGSWWPGEMFHWWKRYFMHWCMQHMSHIWGKNNIFLLKFIIYIFLDCINVISDNNNVTYDFNYIIFDSNNDQDLGKYHTHTHKNK